MSQTQYLIIALAGGFLVITLGVLVHLVIKSKNKESKSQARQTFQTTDFLNTARKNQRAKVTNLEKRMKHACWTLPPLIFNILQVVISIIACFLASIKFNIVLTLVALSVGPLIMNFFLDYAISRRFKAFDRDYAPFILSIVGLLKTGMNTTTALEVAAKGMEDGSLVKEEVLLMLERLRFGVSEEKSVGAFGEDIDHPEIELFVQALMLSKKVGGNLSETLERLARQVRSRQQFRDDARSAVGLQKGSIMFILVILVFIEAYIYKMYPKAVIESIQDDIGWQVWQVGILMMLFGIWLLSKIVKIKV